MWKNNYTVADKTFAGEKRLELKELQVRIEKLSAMPAAYACSFGSNPEEDAAKKLMCWAETNDLIGNSGIRLFGRNTYPTDKPNPRGYEFYLTLNGKAECCGDIETAEVPEGLYAVLRFKNLENIGFAWKKLWNWIEDNGYEPVPTEWIFDLWVPLKE
ncbi:MAG: GyrI-like domain-containing protein [Candidatus Bathyarchaeota archaeon]|nr:GyrI-like domain-containing protein [Candidatus Bathyarchaeota archaeon]